MTTVEAAASEGSVPGVGDAPVFEYLQRHNFKKVLLFNDSRIGLRGVTALHSTALGPATGGIRMWTYPTEQHAIFDALRLARGMTYKYAAAGVNLGGGKTVIIGDPKTQKTEALLRAVGKFIDQLGGEYMAGEDVGTTLDDMEVVHSETDHIVTLPTYRGGAGDISEATALGSIQAMRACAERVWGSPDLAGRRVAVQGLGVVGSQAVRILTEQEAIVTATDIDPEKVTAAVERHGITPAAPEEIHRLDVDIFGPYALGGVINDQTIPELKAKVVAGAANNIFAEDWHGDELERRGIVYGVDYVANSGGTIFDTDRYRKGGFQHERAMANVMRVYDRTVEIFELAERDGIPVYRAADRMAEERIAQIEQVRLLDVPRPTG